MLFGGHFGFGTVIALLLTAAFVFLLFKPAAKGLSAV
jgi:hypothetical protein